MAIIRLSLDRPPVPRFLHPLPQGPTLGARILCQLVLAVEQLAGPEALATMPVLLHINEEQMEEVVHELWSYKFFGWGGERGFAGGPRPGCVRLLRASLHVTGMQCCAWSEGCSP